MEGLKSVEQKIDALYVGDEEINRAEQEKEKKKGGNLLIVEAVLGLRKAAEVEAVSGAYVGTREYRVVGIRCEGVEKMGFVFAEDVTLDDYYGRAPRFGDVAIVDGQE